MEIKKKILFVLILLSFSPLFFSADRERWQADFEGGWVWNGYNDVAIPGDNGTSFSLTSDLQVDGKVFYRLRLTYMLSRKSSLSILYAPLRLKASGRLPKNISFLNSQFPQGADVSAIYRFNSYRFTYSYQVVKNESIHFAVGLTAKIRDAEIALESGSIKESKTNVGFVPLIYLLFDWRLNQRVSLSFETDALAAKQGRAEDVLVSFRYRLNKSIDLKIGYRFVEGGADNDEVYNFALIHYATIGFLIRF